MTTTSVVRHAPVTDQRNERAVLGIYAGQECPHLEIEAFRSDDGSIVVQIDTREGMSGAGAERLRVYINDGAVYSAHVERGDHDIQDVGAYANELAAVQSR